MSQKRRVFFVPADGLIPERGYRVSVVTEGEVGHTPTGTWPYHGYACETLPWFAGHNFKKAQQAVNKMNAQRGISNEEANEIVLRSMSLSGDADAQ